LDMQVPLKFSGASREDACVRSYRDANSGSFEVVRGSQRLAASEGYRFVVLAAIPRSGEPIDFFSDLPGSSDDSHELKSSLDGLVEPRATDVTGDGFPEALIAEWSGGAHCCFTLHVFQFEPAFRTQQIDLGDSDCGVFVQADDDLALEICQPDWTFTYWDASFAQSPVPFILMDFDGFGWRPSAALMRQSQPEFPTRRASSRVGSSGRSASLSARANGYEPRGKSCLR
jgi:hypothetical protein